MPMDFPDMESLKFAAKVHKFREPKEAESEVDFRRCLSDHVEPIDHIESMEIRTGKGWDKFSKDDKAEMIRRAGFKL